MYSSKGDLNRLREWVVSTHDTPLPIGLFVPFETAWEAVKEFIETDGELPKEHRVDCEP
jgi:Immunity protein Imm1